LRLGAFRWMNRWLKDDNSEVTEEERPRFTAQQLRVFERLPADEINTTIHEVLRKPAAPELPKTADEAKAMQERWRRELKTLVFGGWPQKPPALAAKPVAEVKDGGVRLRAWDFVSEENVELRVWLLTAEKTEKPTQVIVNVLDESGWGEWASQLGPAFQETLLSEKVPKRDDARFDQNRKAMEFNRWAFAAVTPRGVGPTRWSAVPGSADDAHIRRRFPLIGQTLDGQRVWDVRRALAVLREVPDLNGAKVELQGRGEAAGLALYAAIFEPEVASLDLWHLPRSHREGPTLLNVRRVFDVPQALTLALPRRVNLHVKDAGKADVWKWSLTFQKLLGRDAIKMHEADD
jgi:hypothetical protein